MLATGPQDVKEPTFSGTNCMMAQLNTYMDFMTQLTFVVQLNTK
jgi:hypothetical protein